MHGFDLYEDGFPHGTAEGYQQGCRGGSCPAGVEHGLSCRKASMKAAGDRQYQRLFAQGMSPAAIAAELNAVPVRLEPPKKRVAVPDLEEAGPIQEEEPMNASTAPSPVDVAKRTTPTSAARSLAERAQDSDPQEDAGGEPTIEREAPAIEPRAEDEAMGHPTTKPEKPIAGHGTYPRWQRGCRTDDGCPGDPETGKTCREARNEYQREGRRRRAKVKLEGAEVEPAPEPIGVALGETRAQLIEEGRVLASEREDLVAAGVDPAELLVPAYPNEPEVQEDPESLESATSTFKLAEASGAPAAPVEDLTAEEVMRDKIGLRPVIESPFRFQPPADSPFRVVDDVEGSEGRPCAC